MEASRRQPGMLEGLSRFLIQHERCGAGFDVAHPSGLGSGRVSITCRGCGARHEYATATIEFEREVTIEPLTPPPASAPAQAPPVQAPPSPGRPSIPPRPAPYPDSTQPPAAAPGEGRDPEGLAPAARRRSEARPTPTPQQAAAAAAAAAAVAARAEPGQLRRPPAEPRRPSPMQSFLRSPRATTALVVIAAVALGFAVVRLVNHGSGTHRNSSTATTGGLTSTATLPTSTTPSPGATTPSPSPAPTTPVPAPPAAQGTTLRTPHFTIEAPRGWDVRTTSGGLLLAPGGGSHVNVQVYFQRSAGLGAGLMSQQTARFLRNEVPGAAILRRKVSVAGGRFYELTARGPGETAVAVDVLRGPYRYLLVRRVFAGAKPDTSRSAGRVVSSFMPR